MDWKLLQQAIKRVNDTDVVDLRRKYSKHPLAELLPEMAVPVTKDDYDALYQIMGTMITTQYILPDGDCIKEEMSLPISFVSMEDDTFYVDFPASDWEQSKAIVQKMIDIVASIKDVV